MLRENPFSKALSPAFFATLQRASEKLDTGSGRISGSAYRLAKQTFDQFLQSDKNALFTPDTMRHCSLVLSLLIQNKTLVNELFIRDKWQLFVDGLRKFAEKCASLNILAKKLLVLFYTHYFLFREKLNNQQAFNRFTALLKQFILSNRNTGHNRMLAVIRRDTNLLDYDLSPYILKLPNEWNTKSLRENLCLNEHFEIFNFIRLVRLITEVKSWQANQYSERVRQIFLEVQQNPHIDIGTDRTLIEEVVYHMLKKCKERSNISPHWENFILLNIGDPRSSKNQFSWKRIGDEYYQWFIALLSKGDLKEFLESLSDGENDKVYQYRKQFWSQYLEHIHYAKIMVGEKDYQRISRTNRDLWLRFQKQPETYGRLKDNQRSSIYMLLKNIHIIETTFNGMARIYKDSPINLYHRDYHYDEFLNSSLIIEEYVHSASEYYTWQSKIRNDINELTGIHIDFDDIVLKSDKSRLKDIRAKQLHKGRPID